MAETGLTAGEVAAGATVAVGTEAPVTAGTEVALGAVVAAGAFVGGAVAGAATPQATAKTNKRATTPGSQVFR